MAEKHFTWKLVAYAGLIAIVAYTGLLFATFASLRERTASRMSQLYRSIFKASEKVTLTKVDVPERKVAQPIVETKPPVIETQARSNPPPIFRSSPVSRPRAKPAARPAEQSASAENPKLHREELPASEPTQEPEERKEPPKGQRQREAYSVLLSENKKMADLVANGNPNLRFKNWSVVKSEGDDYWIDVVLFNKSASEEVHYIWKVSVTSKQIRPESHEAKKLSVM